MSIGTVVNTPASMVIPVGTRGSGDTVILNGSVDDANYAVTQIDFQFPIYGSNYNSTAGATGIYVGTNSYLTFGGGSLEWHNFSHSNPALKKILVAANDTFGTYISEKVITSTKSWLLHFESNRSGFSQCWEITLFSDGVIQLVTAANPDFSPFAPTVAYSTIANAAGTNFTDYTHVANQSYVFVPSADGTTYTTTTGASYVISGAGGTNATITSVAATATSSAIAPTVTAQKNATVTSVVSTGTAQAIAPTVSTTRNVSVTSVITSSVADGIAPTVSAQKQVTITGIVASATASAIAPVVGAVTSVNSVAASANAQAIPPTITTQRQVAVSAVVASSNAAAIAPTVSIVQPNVTIQSVIASAVAMALSPSVLLNFSAIVKRVSISGSGEHASIHGEPSNMKRTFISGEVPASPQTKRTIIGGEV